MWLLFIADVSWSLLVNFVIEKGDQRESIYWEIVENLGPCEYWQHFGISMMVSNTGHYLPKHSQHTAIAPHSYAVWMSRVGDEDAPLVRLPISTIMQILSRMFISSYTARPWLACVAACGLLFLSASSQQALSKTTVTWMMT